MRIALLSDIHSNIQALQACLAHAAAQAPDQYAFLGDFVGYGAAPVEVMDVIMTYASRGAWVLLGNHDEMVFSVQNTEATQASSSAEWTRMQLPEHQVEFLRTLPLQIQHEGNLFVHASAKDPGQWHYVDSEMRADQCMQAAEKNFQAQRVFTGHVHHQTLYYRGADQKMMLFMPTPGASIPLSRQRTMVATIGSVGQPRDGDTRAMYALLDCAKNSLAFHRVPYLFSKTADDIRRAGLPEKLAQRIEAGR